MLMIAKRTTMKNFVLLYISHDGHDQLSLNIFENWHTAFLNARSAAYENTTRARRAIIYMRPDDNHEHKVFARDSFRVQQEDSRQDVCF
jgi:hypothetical protein